MGPRKGPHASYWGRVDRWQWTSIALVIARGLGRLVLREVPVRLAVQADPAPPDVPLPIPPQIPGREHRPPAHRARPALGRVGVGERVVGAALDGDVFPHLGYLYRSARAFRQAGFRAGRVAERGGVLREGPRGRRPSPRSSTRGSWPAISGSADEPTAWRSSPRSSPTAPPDKSAPPQRKLVVSGKYM